MKTMTKLRHCYFASYPGKDSARDSFKITHCLYLDIKAPSRHLLILFFMPGLDRESHLGLRRFPPPSSRRSKATPSLTVLSVECKRLTIKHFHVLACYVSMQEYINHYRTIIYVPRPPWDSPDPPIPFLPVHRFD